MVQVFRTTGKVQCVNITPHYVMGGAHNVMYIWNMISLDNAPMFVLPHPRFPVLTFVVFMYPSSKLVI